MNRHLDITPSTDAPPRRLLDTEWLLTNGRGSYASSTVAGVNTRKYHGLLVSAVRPPGERFVLLAGLIDELVLDGRSFPLACFQFDGAFHPRGDRHLTGFDCDTSSGSVAFSYQLDRLRLVKRIALARGADAIAVRYELAAPGGRDQPLRRAEGKPVAARVRVLPLLAYRHYHGNRHAGSPPDMRADFTDGAMRLIDPGGILPAMRIAPAAGRFAPAPDWWHRFFYRAEADRGEDPWEDLFTPGTFDLDFDAEGACELRAAVEPSSLPSPSGRGGGGEGCRILSFADATASQVKHHDNLRAAASQVESYPSAPSPACGSALFTAADDFVVRLPDGAASILAGYHWFADWGRDAFIALPGLLLATGRFDQARAVLTRFAGAIRNGLVPNRFSDEGGGEDYNSVDASLWFIHAAFAWAEAAGQWDDFDAELLAPVRAILDAFDRGTDHDIRADADGLLTAGSPTSQLTWMDATVDGVPVTPRAGKPVEVNALYGHALRRVAERLEARGEPSANVYRARRARWAGSFVAKFPSPRGGLTDCIGLDGQPDLSVRPNQVLAVALGDSPLSADIQRQVVELAREKLLTPFGLRSLAADEPGYRGRCAGTRRERDAAYHQGTVWAWLIGPFLEAYLRVEGFSDGAKRQAAGWLEQLLEHMNGDAGLGQISEIFDGDPPHTPRGCIAQAWSVAEVLRARALIPPRKQQGHQGSPRTGKIT